MEVVRTAVCCVQALHADIQARSKDIGAVQQLCELVNTASRVQGGGGAKVSGDCDRQLAGVAALRRQWHRAWLQSVEWQCRLEEALEDRLAGKVSYFLLVVDKVGVLIDSAVKLLGGFTIAKCHYTAISSEALNDQ